MSPRTAVLVGPPAARPGSGRAPRAWYLGTHLVVAGWLGAGIVVAAAHPVMPRARWLLVHTLLLGAASTAVLVWSEHFVQAVLRARPAGTAGRVARLALFTAGALAVVAGVAVGHGAPVAGGAAAIAVAVTLHALALGRRVRGALPGRFAFLLRYYVAAALMLPVGALLGALLATSRNPTTEAEARLRLAHEAVNVLGWLGITIVGTMSTLWPTVLRTRLADGAERAARRAVGLLAAGVALVAGAALVGAPVAVLPGLALYVAGVVVSARPWVGAAQARPPADVPAWSLAAGAGWLAVLLAGLAVAVLGDRSWPEVGDRAADLTPVLAVGWVAQTVLGALGFLVPMLVGGGPAAVRASARRVEQGGPARVTMLNAGLAVALLPVPPVVRVLSATVVLGTLVAHVVLLAAAVRAGVRHRSAGSPPEVPGPVPPPEPVRASGFVAGLGAVVLAVALGGALDPGGLPAVGGASEVPWGAARVVPTGRTTTVTVVARGMRFTPAELRVPRGDRLVVLLRNESEDRHDLVLSNGARTPRIAPGAGVTLEVGVVGGGLDGWCSVVGHRQMGMTLRVVATGTDPGAGRVAGLELPEGGAEGADATVDGMAAPAAGFAVRDPQLEPLPTATAPRVVRRTLTIREVDRETAPGVRRRAWTFDGVVPGPVLHARVGDIVEITLVNGGTMGHSIDFHAGSVAPSPVMRTIQPGSSLVYRFPVTRSGIWMYHCSTMPMSLHIANGMFGAVVVDPPDLARVDREYVLIQSEVYVGPTGGTADIAALRAARPDLVVFNGYPNQYVTRPLRAAAGERVRVWVLAAGPNLGTSFHVVGGQFDTVFVEGGYRLRPGGTSTGGAQVLELGPAAGGFVEFALPEPGSYPFVSHRMVDAERGARGVIVVTPPSGPTTVPSMTRSAA